MDRLKHYASYLLQEHHDRLRRKGKTQKRFLLEIGVVAAVLFAVLLSATLLTPYEPRLQLTGETVAGEQYYRARVESVGQSESKVRLLDGPRRGQVTEIANPDNGLDYGASSDAVKVVPGGAVLVTDAEDGGFIFIEHYRIPLLVGLIVAFAGLVILVGGRQGVGSVIGLAVTVMVIGWFIIPFIVTGHDPLLICITGAYLIAFASITIAHGFKRRTYLAVFCVAVVLAIIAFLANVIVWQMRFSGVLDESVLHFMTERPQIDMVGVLIGGIIIASLGVLDDIVTAQVATVDELLKANASLGIRELFWRGMSVGREHISALVNTLALVYIGAALPVVVAMSVFAHPLVYVNHEYIATEIARTLVASMGLVLSVPISTIIAATYFRRYAPHQEK